MQDNTISDFLLLETKQSQIIQLQDEVEDLKEALKQERQEKEHMHEVMVELKLELANATATIGSLRRAAGRVKHKGKDV